LLAPDLVAAAVLLAVDLAAVPRRAVVPFPLAVAGVVLAPLLAPAAGFAALPAGGVRDCAMSSCPSVAGAPGWHRRHNRRAASRRSHDHHHSAPDGARHP
jgi:hypothetical protein